MRKEYGKNEFVEAMIRRNEGYVLYKDNSIEFFKTIEQANDVFENSTNAIECGSVKEEVANYSPEIAEELRTKICKEFSIPDLRLDPEKSYT